MTWCGWIISRVLMNTIPFRQDRNNGGSQADWEKGPGLSIFKKMQKTFGTVNIIAEDLGFVTDSVEKLVKDTGFPSHEGTAVCF